MVLQHFLNIFRAFINPDLLKAAASLVHVLFRLLFSRILFEDDDIRCVKLTLMSYFTGKLIRSDHRIIAICNRTSGLCVVE